MKGKVTAQRLAIPAYFPPGPIWGQMQRAAPTVGIAVVNPASGPGAAANPAYVTAIAASREAGIRVCGYVDTDRTGRDLAAVQAEIARYCAWYPIGGIFLDQASTTTDALPYYAALHRFIQTKMDDACVILNPGTTTDERYMNVADILVMFEDTYRVYRTAYRGAGWEQNYPPERFWHLVHTTRTVRQLRHAVALSRKRHAGYVYVTPGALPNPWDRLPEWTSWPAEHDAITYR
jgi:hypothetical protein